MNISGDIIAPGIKAATATAIGATAQGTLNAMTRAEELFNETVKNVKEAGLKIQFDINSHLPGFREGRKRPLMSCDIDLICAELFKRYTENPGIFTEDVIKYLAYIVGNFDNKKYFIIDRKKYEQFAEERSDAATAGLIFSAAAGAGMDSLYSATKVPSSDLNPGTSAILSTGLGTVGVLASNKIAEYITKIKTTIQIDSDADMTTKLASISIPTTIETANDNISRLGILLDEEFNQSNIISQQLTLYKAELKNIIRGKQPASALTDDKSRQKLLADRRQNVAPIQEKINSCESQLITITNNISNILLKVNENNEFIEVHSNNSVTKRAAHLLSNMLDYDMFSGKVIKRTGGKTRKNKHQYTRKNKYHHNTHPKPHKSNKSSKNLRK
jgi:hypothetical protein